MAQSLIQTSFFGGELSPNLYGTVDLAQYKKSAALLRNFFVDYRGGASTRFGTKYDLQAFNSAFPVRLIPFTASFTVTYVMEFGQNYIRFHTNGGPVLEATQAISAVSTGGGTITSAGTYNIGDWLYVLSVGGVTGINGNYYIITGVAGSVYTVTDLFGNAPAWGGSFTSGGTTARVYTIQTPWLGADLALLKFAQNVQFMIFTHPNYPAQLLTYNGPTNWVLSQITYGTTVPTPTSPSVSQSGGSSTAWNTAYVVTAIDVNGQESGPSAVVTITAAEGLGITTGSFSNVVTWTAVSGAIFYNIYRAPIAFHSAGVPSGAVYGLAGSTNGTTFIESPGNFTAANYSISPPVAENPFLGGPVASATVTTPGTYNTPPTITFAAPSSGATATGTVALGLTAVTVNAGGFNYKVGDLVYFTHGVVLVVKTVGGGGSISAYQPLTYPGTSIGSVTSGNAGSSLNTTGTNGSGSAAVINTTWGVSVIQINNGGSGYTSAPAITFSSGAAAATAVLGTLGGNPSVPCYFQQRLALASPPTAQQTVYLSVPGSPYNFNTHQVIQPDDAITAVLVSKQLNAIKSMVPMPSGLVIMTSSSAWLLNGGSGPGSPVTATNLSAQSQAYNGANDVPPIVANDDILYVQAKGSIVRDLRFNFYTSVYTGTDISVMAEHLFFGYQIKEWAWAEEPFKLVWAVRNDGILLSLTFSKEQEIYGWAHSDTLGLFQSVASVTESTPSGNVDATYVCVQRSIQGQTLQYIERLADRFMPYGIEDTWALDCAIQSAGATPAATLTPAAASGVGVAFVASAAVFSAPQVGNVIRVGGGIATITAFVSTTQVTCTITQPITAVYTNGLPIPQASGNWTQWIPSTTFTGLSQLNGQTVTALADGVVVSGLTVSNGSITLPNPATKVLVGLPYTPQLQTLPLDAGQPTIQGKRKRLGPITFKVVQTRGLSIGRTFSTLVNVKDAGPPMLSPFPNLYFGDIWVVPDALYDPYGQTCFQQNNPWPATIMANVPDTSVGDTSK